MHNNTSAQDDILLRQLESLKQNFHAEGKNIFCSLEKLHHEKNLDYTDYLCIDTMLSLQKPRTDFPDEMVFILFHQASELLFRMITWELEQLTQPEKVASDEVFLSKVERVNRYMRTLIYSFDIMLDGLDMKEFQKFRYALFPASGFQSFQYRLIEIYATDALNLVGAKERHSVSGTVPIETIYQKMYWKGGGVDVISGEKTQMLLDFEKRYDKFLLQKVKEYQGSNLWQRFSRHYQESSLYQELVEALRSFDRLANQGWTSAHYKVAMKHLSTGGPQKLSSTGGTNWRKYLHARFQKVSFFPSLWSAEELAEWGAIS